MMGRLDRCYNIADLRDVARRRLPKGVFEYLDKGTEDMVALGGNRRAFDEMKLLNRVLVDVSDVRLDTEIFGKPSSLPLVIAPTGIAGLCWYEGEYELAKAAAKAGVPFTLATGSNTPMEKVSAGGGRPWFQLYMWREKELSYELVRRAAAAGFETLVWTVDIGHGANREHNARNGFSQPYKMNARSVVDVMRHPEWLATVIGRYVATTGMPVHANYPEHYQGKITGKASAAKALRADKVSWADVDRLREIWPGKLVIKGIMRPDDARRAVDHGVDGIVVSNHGGRNMDSAPPTIHVLPGIVEAVGDKTTVIVDSGVRRGSDIVKCLALGARAVLTGRATLYGIGAGGEAGATKALAILKDEMRRTMAYIGKQRVADVSGDDIWRG
ncbi:MAG: alpha-hydroxy-acid oxidizing protein [Beijerinckiaceae bacterium]|jgi:(S)-mandelate dehydrogenase|nr:alpha-hydroxy-acid oxidizing protein [Beijerinckiaceae bacterium]